MNTILSLRYWQSNLPPKDCTTTYSRWMNASFQRIRALLPIYFDRTRIYANHCYGFNTSKLLDLEKSMSTNSNSNTNNNGKNTGFNSPTDHNSNVMEFLHRNKKLGGQLPMAIAIVLDAIGAGNLRVERGFCLEKNDIDPTKVDDVRLRWPAIYLRSTIHFGTHPQRSDAGGSGIFNSSQASLLSTWSVGGSHGLSIPGGSPFSMTNRKQPSTLLSQLPLTPPTSHSKLKTISLPASSMSDVAATAAAPSCDDSTALEYGPESGVVTSWPHCDWTTVASLISSNVDSDHQIHAHETNVRHNAMKYQNDSPGDERQYDSTGNSLVRSGESELSTLYCVSLGPYLWLVMMFKKSDSDGRVPPPPRAKSHITVDEIHKFMTNGFGTKLRVASIFTWTFALQFVSQEDNDTKGKESNHRKTTSSKMVQKLHLPTLPMVSSSSIQIWSEETHVQEFLRHIKASFGLRPSTSSPSKRGVGGSGSGSRSSMFGTPRTPTEIMNDQRYGGVRHRGTSRSKPCLSETASAAMYFLGPDLASSFDSFE
jgi:hypothetical protein